jgi:hypothetical protein
MTHEPAPPQLDNLLLDIGGTTGALIIYADADRDGTEIEVSPTTDARAQTHNVVRARQTPASSCHAAVFPALSEGDYTIWHDAGIPAATITVHGGHVTSHLLTGSAG